MSNIELIVDSLENKISKMLHKLENLKQINESLKNELTVAKQEIDTQLKYNAEWEDKYNALKTANSILGSNDNKRETKLKINALIRDLDHCIAQISD